MKALLLTLIIFVSQLTFGQAENFGWNKRLSFVAGGGASFISSRIYNIPVINKSNNFVIIEEADVVKSNLSFGIVYTPFVSNVIRKIKIIKDGKFVIDTLIEYYPRGITFALLLNPISLSNVAESSFSNTIDIGYGFGWRSGNITFLLTNEYFAIRQPREYFIRQFEGNDKSFIVNGQIQTLIDQNDDSIFLNKIAVSWGFKVVYTFDIIKSFYKNSKGQSHVEPPNQDDEG